jgi:rhodanese-related sulfurtransferase
MAVKIISPEEARHALDAGARLIDIRTADEHARERIPEALNVPLDRITELECDDRPVVFHCRSGMRTTANAALLASAAGDATTLLLDGGIDAWRRQGFATIIDRGRPLEIMRQVQIAAGVMILAGILLGLLVSPVFLGLSAFVGAGLTFAGTTGWCGMAMLLRQMPWNRRLAA